MADLKTPKSVNWNGYDKDFGSKVIETPESRSEVARIRKSERDKALKSGFSSVLIGFLVIVLLASLIFVPSFLTDLDVFLPTEEKIVDENGVVHYEVTSNWSTEDVMTVGEKSMQVFSTFGNFISGFGDLVGTAFGYITKLFPSVDEDISTFESALDCHDYGYLNCFNNELDYWRFYTAVEFGRMPHLVGRVPSNANVTIYVVSLSLVNKYYADPSAYCPWYLQPIAGMKNLLGNWCDMYLILDSSGTTCSCLYIVSDNDYIELGGTT